MFIVYNAVMFKVPMKRYSLMRFSKISSSKCAIPKFAASTAKIEDFSSFESWFIFPQKNSIQIARPKYHVTLASDVLLGAKQQTNMDDCGKSKSRGGRHCLAGARKGQSCKNRCKKGTQMHQFPSDQTLKAKWVKFVRRHRPDFKDPTSRNASLSEAHFEDSCYEHNQFIDMSDTTITQIMWR